MEQALLCRSVKTLTGTNGKVIGYRIVCIDGSSADVKKDNLKNAIANGKILCANLRLSSDGRLINSNIESSTFENIANTIANNTGGHRDKTVINGFEFIVRFRNRYVLHSRVDLAGGVYFTDTELNASTKILSDKSIADAINIINKNTNGGEKKMIHPDFYEASNVPNLRDAARKIEEYNRKELKNRVNSCAAQDNQLRTVNVLVVRGTSIVAAIINDKYTVTEIDGKAFYSILEDSRFSNIDRNCNIIKGTQKFLILKEEAYRESAILNLLIPSIASADFLSADEICKFKLKRIPENTKDNKITHTGIKNRLECAYVNTPNKQIVTTKEFVLAITSEYVAIIK